MIPTHPDGTAQVLPRMEMRERYHIRGQMMNDFFVSFFCNPCALTQERREVEEEERCYRVSQQDVAGDEK